MNPHLPFFPTLQLPVRHLHQVLAWSAQGIALDEIKKKFKLDAADEAKMYEILPDSRSQAQTITSADWTYARDPFSMQFPEEPEQEH